MEFKNSVSILFSNIGYVFKLIVWILISAALTAGVGAAIITPIWRTLAATTDINAHIEEIRTILANVWTGSLNMRAAAHTLVPEAINSLYSLNQNAGAFAGLMISCMFLYALYCFLRGLSFYSLADIINTLMTSNMRYGLASNMAMNMKNNAKFSICRLAISFPIDIVFLLALIAMTLTFYQLIGFFTMPILLVLCVVFFSLRATLFAGWLPRMLYHPEERTFTAFSRSLVYVKYNFIDFFKAFAIIFSILYLLAYVCGMPTGGLMFIVLMPTHFFLLRTVELVGYFKTKGLSFYTDGSTIVNTVDYGLRLANQGEDIPDELKGDVAKDKKESDQ